MDDVDRVFALGLRALEVASQRLKEACEGDDLDAAAIEAHFDLHAVYDLHEAYFKPAGIHAAREQDEIYDSLGGEVVGALVFARGGRTHQLITFATKGGWGDLPYGMGPYGGGWLWGDFASTKPAYVQRSAWYESRVHHRYLWTPLDEAWAWFLRNTPRRVERITEGPKRS